jgi:tRNA U55 pseudouridine synthase TruB
VRLGSGRFALEEAVSLERLEEAFEHGQEADYVFPLDHALLDWPAMIVGADDARRIVQGQAVRGDLLEMKDEAAMGRAYGPNGEFLAIMFYQAKAGLWRPKKVFS